MTTKLVEGGLYLASGRRSFFLVLDPVTKANQRRVWIKHPMPVFQGAVTRCNPSLNYQFIGDPEEWVK